jgi:hypothetical protein
LDDLVEGVIGLTVGSFDLGKRRGGCCWAVLEKSKQWYANASSSPNSLANSSIGLLPPLRLSHQQEHWDRGPMEIKSAEDRDATDWNSRWFFSPAVRRAPRKFQISNIFG